MYPKYSLIKKLIAQGLHETLTNKKSTPTKSLAGEHCRK